MLADVFDDEMTRELPSALRTFTDLEPFVPIAPIDSSDAIDPGPRTEIPELTLVIGAIVLVWSCAFAGAFGIVVGRTSEPRDHEVVANVHVPRVAVVMAAHEAITEPPPMAPAKVVFDETSPPRVFAAAPHAVAPAPRRPGFQRPSTLGRR